MVVTLLSLPNEVLSRIFEEIRIASRLDREVLGWDLEPLVKTSRWNCDLSTVPGTHWLAYASLICRKLHAFGNEALYHTLYIGSKDLSMWRICLKARPDLASLVRNLYFCNHSNGEIFPNISRMQQECRIANAILQLCQALQGLTWSLKPDTLAFSRSSFLRTLGHLKHFTYALPPPPQGHSWPKMLKLLSAASASLESLSLSDGESYTVCGDQLERSVSVRHLILESWDRWLREDEMDFLAGQRTMHDLRQIVKPSVERLTIRECSFGRETIRILLEEYLPTLRHVRFEFIDNDTDDSDRRSNYMTDFPYSTLAACNKLEIVELQVEDLTQELLEGIPGSVRHLKLVWHLRAMSFLVPLSKWLKSKADAGHVLPVLELDVRRNWEYDVDSYGNSEGERLVEPLLQDLLSSVVIHKLYKTRRIVTVPKSIAGLWVAEHGRILPPRLFEKVADPFAKRSKPFEQLCEELVKGIAQHLPVWEGDMSSDNGPRLHDLRSALGSVRRLTGRESILDEQTIRLLLKHLASSLRQATFQIINNPDIMKVTMAHMPYIENLPRDALATCSHLETPELQVHDLPLELLQAVPPSVSRLKLTWDISAREFWHPLGDWLFQKGHAGEVVPVLQLEVRKNRVREIVEVGDEEISVRHLRDDFQDVRAVSALYTRQGSTTEPVSLTTLWMQEHEKVVPRDLMSRVKEEIARVS